MMRRFAVVGLSLLVVLASSAGLLAQDKKQQEAQKREIAGVVKLADDVAAGQPAPNDLALTWVREDYLKASGNKQFVPFTVTIDPSKLSPGTVAFYWRVVSTTPGAEPPPAPPASPRKNDDKNPPKREFAYESISFVPVTPGPAPLRISREFSVPSGSYDLFVVIKEPTPEKAPKNAPPPKASVLKQALTIPDFWNGELNTSSVIIAERIEPLSAPLTPQQQIERPYALGGIEIVPAAGLKFPKTVELSTFMLIYNPKIDAANKPDVTVEYNFYAKGGGSEKFFNKTSPQNLNAQTLPPQFDFAAGHQLQTGQAVPLTSFPEGEYRLEIKITDKIASKSITRDVNFTVTGS